MSLIRAESLAGRVIGQDSFFLADWIDDGSMPGTPIAPLHRHLKDDEIWYVLSGRLAFSIGEETVEAGPGAAVLGPAGVPHTYWNPSDEPARYLLVMSPDTVRLIERLHEAGSPDELGELFRRHGCELLG
ncbi:cupin domain-containing protein [Nonomuraea sp. NPDC050663]|uniref:cupin domain-containing protein n=1 Tax=Nonomuraea sp. NPDC050663 TaxID=3364370 RepID=UPI0037B9FB46